VDRKLRTELDAIAQDEHSGAAELALRAASALQAWLRRHRKLTETELLEVARVLLRAQPSMAPILRLANEVALSMDHERPRQALGQSLRRFQSELRRGPEQIAALFYRWLKRRKQWRIGAYSYSSTVAKALVRARALIKQVDCSEGRPGYEGRRMAERLARAGINVWLSPDAPFLEDAWFPDLQVCGADAVTQDGFVNKVGTQVIVSQASRAGHPVIVLAETMKFWPESPFRVTRFWMSTDGHPWEVWKDAPENVRIDSPLFSCAPFGKHVFLLTERGWMKVKQIRRELRKICISPRLEGLAD
jgi:translation initiation factor eIF-2B subunit delta